MKKVFVKTQNVKAFITLINSLNTKPEGVSRMALVYGEPGLEETNDLNDLRKPLYCLFPQRIGSESLLVVALRESFIKTAIDGKLLDFINKQADSLNQEQTELLKIQRQRERISINSYLSRGSRYSRRRFPL
jgi:hypothetical protein